MLSKKSCSFTLLVYVQIKLGFYRQFQSSKCPKLQGLETITEFAQKTIMGFAKEQSFCSCAIAIIVHCAKIANV